MTIKPIMVGHMPLKLLEQAWDAPAELWTESDDDPTLENLPYAFAELLENFKCLALRLRKEVERHKVTKKKLAELQAKVDRLELENDSLNHQLVASAVDRA